MMSPNVHTAIAGSSETETLLSETLSTPPALESRVDTIEKEISYIRVALDQILKFQT